MLQRPLFVVICAVTVMILLAIAIGLYSLNATVVTRIETISKTVDSLRDSLATLQSQLNTLKDQVPGLGEYMTTFQLHMAKLWFATQASNWGLAQYELGELTETMEAAEALHAVKNNVNTASVLQSVRETQLPMLQKSLQGKNKSSFAGAYDQTIRTCNSCHRSVGYGFINITKPLALPVANQAWGVTR